MVYVTESDFTISINSGDMMGGGRSIHLTALEISLLCKFPLLNTTTYQSGVTDSFWSLLTLCV